MKTKPIIDIKRLEWLITKGEASYSDGRHSFEYEMLLDLMKRLKVRVNQNAAYRRIEEIHTAKQIKRPKGNLKYETQSPHCPWRIQVEKRYFKTWGKPEIIYPSRTAKEILNWMKWLRNRHDEDVANDNCDYDEVRMSFKFIPSPKKQIP